MKMTSEKSIEGLFWISALILFLSFSFTPSAFGQEQRLGSRPFSFCTIEFTSVRGESLGFGWNTDYPDSGYALMQKIEELTTIQVAKNQDGTPSQVAISLTDPKLPDYPYIFMSDVGTLEFSNEEVASLREYFVTGGLLHVDDFWGPRSRKYWREQIRRVLPLEEFPIVDVPKDHDIFTKPFAVGEMPQIPSIQFWRTTGETSERGAQTNRPFYRGIFDASGRLIVFMSFNTDVADGWEGSNLPNEDKYKSRFSQKAVYLGINLVSYALAR